MKRSTLIKRGDTVNADKMKSALLSKDELCKMFGCTIEQLDTQYQRNANQLNAMANKAKKTGKKLNGYTSDQLNRHTDNYQQLSRPKKISELQKQAATAPKYILKLDFCDQYVSDEQELTGINFTDDKTKAREYSVGFDNVEMKKGIWTAEARKLMNNKDINLEVIYL